MICKYALFSSILMTGIIGSTAQEYYYNNGMDGDNGMDSLVHCFQCNSQQDPECRNIQPNDTSNWAYKPCLDTDKYEGHTPFCRKIVQKIFPRDNMEVVIRKCGWVTNANNKACYMVRNEDHVETICQCFESGCNGAAGSVASLALVSLAALAIPSFCHLVW